MGAFDLPTGDFQLLLKDAKGTKWTSVMFTDSLDRSEIAETVEDWSVNHEVLSARYNGREVVIPKKYHWELQLNGEVLGSYKTYKEARAEFDRRRIQYRKDKTTRPGRIVFVDYVQVRFAD